MGNTFLRISRVSDRHAAQVKNLEIPDLFRWTNCTIYGAILDFDFHSSRPTHFRPTTRVRPCQDCTRHVLLPKL